MAVAHGLVMGLCQGLRSLRTRSGGLSGAVSRSRTVTGQVSLVAAAFVAKGDSRLPRRNAQPELALVGRDGKESCLCLWLRESAVIVIARLPRYCALACYLFVTACCVLWLISDS